MDSTADALFNFAGNWSGAGRPHIQSEQRRLTPFDIITPLFAEHRYVQTVTASANGGTPVPTHGLQLR